MKKIINLVYWLVLLAVVVVALGVVLSSFNTPFGLRVFAVQSGSMEPAIHVGSLVLVRPSNDYQADDVITVRSERSAKETVTHRIVEVIDDDTLGGRNYELKGDANENPDSELLPERRVIGKVFLTLPYLGYPVGFAQSQVGFVALIVIPGTIIVYSELMNIKKEIMKMFKKKEKKEGENEESE